MLLVQLKGWAKSLPSEHFPVCHPYPHSSSSLQDWIKSSVPSLSTSPSDLMTSLSPGLFECGSRSNFSIISWIDPVESLFGWISQVQPPLGAHSIARTALLRCWLITRPAFNSLFKLWCVWWSRFWARHYLDSHWDPNLPSKHSVTAEESPLTFV